MQPATAAPAMWHFSALRSCMELLTFCAAFSFRWAHPVHSGKACEDDLIVFLLIGWCTHVASHAAPGSGQHSAAISTLARIKEQQKGRHAFDPELWEAGECPLLLLVPPYGHEDGVDGEWIEYSRHDHFGRWKAPDEMRAHGLPLRPSPLLIADSELSELNATLHRQAGRLLHDIDSSEMFDGNASGDELAPAGAAAMQALMRLTVLPTASDTAHLPHLPAWGLWPSVPTLSAHFAGRTRTPAHVLANAAFILPPEARQVLPKRFRYTLAAPGAADASSSSVAQGVEPAAAAPDTKGSSERELPQAECQTSAVVRDEVNKRMAAVVASKAVAKHSQGTAAVVRLVLPALTSLLSSQLNALPPRSVYFEVRPHAVPTCCSTRHDWEVFPPRQGTIV